MQRVSIQEREDWKAQAEEFGFLFHTIYGDKYWDESAYYQFTLQQVENDLEDSTEEIHKMCLEVVDCVTRDDELMRKFQIPEGQWDFVRTSWKNGDPSLYSRIDLAYDGKVPAKLYENNGDTPTSLYEAGFWQWLWLEQQMQSNKLSNASDQFNSLQDKIVERFRTLHAMNPDKYLYFSCCRDTVEDRGTVQYLEDCAKEAGIYTKFVYIEDIGADNEGRYTDTDDYVIDWCFKLYPWEFMFREDYKFLGKNKTIWLEPAWKSIVSNKALLPMLWKMFPGHPNLLPSFFEEEKHKADVDLVRKPLFSREGANIQLDGKESEGPYGEEGYIYQAKHLLPNFNDNYTVIGSWLVDGQPAGLSIREDKNLITQDTSRFLPHIIL